MFSPIELPGGYHNVTLEILSSLKAIELLPSIIYHCVLMVLGSIGNIFVILVYLKKFNPSTHRSFILVLACFDLFASLVGVPLVIYDMQHIYTYDSEVGCRLYRFFQYVPALGSGTVLVLISFERKRKICQPLDLQMSVKTAHRILIFFVGSFTLLASGLSLAVCGLMDMRTGISNVTGNNCFISRQIDGTVYYYIFNGFLWLIAVVMSLCLSINYVYIGLKIKTMNNIRRKLSCSVSYSSASGEHNEIASSDRIEEKPESSESKSIPSLKRLKGKLSIQWNKRSGHQRVNSRNQFDRKSVRVTKMLICVTVTFVISFLPHLSVLIATVINDPEDLPQDNTFMFIFSTYLINNIVNPFIYAAMDKKFRAKLKELLCGWRD